MFSGTNCKIIHMQEQTTRGFTCGAKEILHIYLFVVMIEVGR